MQIYNKYLKTIYLQDCIFQMLRVAIFLLKQEIDLLSLIFSGKEFQMEAPLYRKLFFILFVFGFGKRIELEVPRCITSVGHVGGKTSKCRRSAERKMNGFLFIKHSPFSNMVNQGC